MGVSNWVEVAAWVLIVAVMVFFALLTNDYFRRGRHRGDYPYTVQHRGLGKLHDGKCQPMETHGRFGDLDIDRADGAAVRPFLPDGTVDHQGLRKDGWWPIGTLATEG